MATTEKTHAPTDCRECGHPAAHHDAGECWTNHDDTESVENTCGCYWYEPIEKTNSGEESNDDD